jgi:hypothetical protein
VYTECKPRNLYSNTVQISHKQPSTTERISDMLFIAVAISQ